MPEENNYPYGFSRTSISLDVRLMAKAREYTSKNKGSLSALIGERLQKFFKIKSLDDLPVPADASDKKPKKKKSKKTTSPVVKDSSAPSKNSSKKSKGKKKKVNKESNPFDDEPDFDFG